MHMQHYTGDQFGPEHSIKTQSEFQMYMLKWNISYNEKGSRTEWALGIGMHFPLEDILPHLYYT